MAKKKKPVSMHKVRLSKVSKHEHNLLHTLFIAARKDLLSAFVHNLEYMHNGLDFADLLMEQENLTIFSAFPWQQTGQEGTWKQLKNDIAVSAQYPEYRGKEDDNEDA